ncbi:hypothetical protein [Streptomyces pakalii]|uniref:Alpha amylase inhibitor n=1 Tax=Streptomyces pakalii TaxID=3036494 RepID=A0ABT7DHH4_9ACTN|nr:hypothetical protein [Streptomyces pakalii]MDJ1645284.1 hypothetical protein [Streptomyces pakalii]
MNLRHSLVGASTAVAILSTALVGMSAPAQAAPVQAAAANAPKCVKTRLYNTASDYTVQIHNTCKSAKKVRIIMRFGKDGPCKKVKKGGYYYRRTNSIAVWQATVKC